MKRPILFSILFAFLLTAPIAHSQQQQQQQLQEVDISASVADENINEVFAVESFILLGQFDTAPWSAEVAGACQELSLTEAQKTSLRTTGEAAMREFRSQRDLLKNEMQAYKDVLKRTDQTRGAAEEALRAVMNRMSIMGDLKADLKHDVLYDILTPNQREAALSCLDEIRKTLKDRWMKKLCGGGSR